MTNTNTGASDTNFEPSVIEIPSEADSATDPSNSETAKQVRGSSILLAGRILSMALGLGTQVLMVRYLTKADYGAFAYALSFIATAKIFVTLGHDRTITRFLSIYDERRDYAKLFGTLVMETIIIAATSACLLGCLLIFEDLLAGSLIEDRQAIIVLQIMLILAPVEASGSLIEGMFAVLTDAKAIFFRRYVLSPGLQLVAVLLLVTSGAGVMFLAAAYVLAGLVGLAVSVALLVHVMRNRGLLHHFNLRAVSLPFREVFTFSVPLLSTELVVVTSGAVSTVILGHFDGTTAVAAYRVILPAAVMNSSSGGPSAFSSCRSARGCTLEKIMSACAMPTGRRLSG